METSMLWKCQYETGIETSMLWKRQWGTSMGNCYGKLLWKRQWEAAMETAMIAVMETSML